MTPITITEKHIKATGESFGRPTAEWLALVCNKANEIAQAEYEADWLKLDAEKKQETYITAEEARKLGAGNAEFQYNDGKWGVCDKWCIYNDTENFKYRAIQAQPEPTLSMEMRIENEAGLAWADVPVGVAVRDKTTGVVWLYQGSENGNAVLNNHPGNPFGSRWIDVGDLEIAPAADQPWVAVQGVETGRGVTQALQSKGFMTALHGSYEKYRITGVAEGYKLEGQK